MISSENNGMRKMVSKRTPGIPGHIFGIFVGVLWTGATFFMAKGAIEMNNSFEEDGMGFGPFICIPWLFVIIGIIIILVNIYGVVKKVTDKDSGSTKEEPDHTYGRGMDVFRGRFGGEGPFDTRKKIEKEEPSHHRSIKKWKEEPLVDFYHKEDEEEEAPRKLKKEPGLVKPPPGSDEIEKELENKCNYCGADLRDDIKFCPECLEDI